MKALSSSLCLLDRRQALLEHCDSGEFPRRTALSCLDDRAHAGECSDGRLCRLTICAIVCVIGPELRRGGSEGVAEGRCKRGAG